MGSYLSVEWKSTWPDALDLIVKTSTVPPSSASRECRWAGAKTGTAGQTDGFRPGHTRRIERCRGTNQSNHLGKGENCRPSVSFLPASIMWTALDGISIVPSFSSLHMREGPAPDRSGLSGCASALQQSVPARTWICRRNLPAPHPHDLRRHWALARTHGAHGWQLCVPTCGLV